MSDSRKNEISSEDIFQIICIASEAKNYLHEAFNNVKSGSYKESEELLLKANETLNEAHKLQTKLITLEAQRVKTEIGILMIHAQDHLMNCVMMKELMVSMIEMQKEINSLKER